MLSSLFLSLPPQLPSARAARHATGAPRRELGPSTPVRV